MTPTAIDLPGLLERGDELERLHELIGDAAARRGRAVAVTGPAGIGKSNLPDAARDHARAAGVLRLAARRGDLERDHPFGIFRPLFERRLLELPEVDRAAVLDGPAAAGAAALGVGTNGPAAAAAARGPVNREIAQALFVTVRTVQVHLAGAFRELGVGSRRDLAGVPGLFG